MDVLTELLEAPDTIKLIADTLVKVRKPILLMKQLAQFLVRLNTPERPIANEYCEGKVKRTPMRGVK